MPTAPFDIKAAFRLSAAAFGISMIVGVLLILLAPSTADAKQLGQGIGQFAALSFIGGFLASFQEQNGNILQARILKIAWILGCIGLVIFALTYPPASPTP